MTTPKADARLERLRRLDKLAVEYCKQVAPLTWTLEMKHGFMGGYVAAIEAAAKLASQSEFGRAHPKEIVSLIEHPLRLGGAVPARYEGEG